VSRIAYVNGQYVPLGEASVHIEDRGFQFADGVYEVCEIRDGCIVDGVRHLARLRRSLHELQMQEPMDERALNIVIRETVRRNRVRDGFIYIQVTRGVARRDFLFPGDDVMPTLVVIARAVDPAKVAAPAVDGVRVVTVEETRWARVDIKTTGLLANVLAKETARAAKAKEAWFVDRDGYVTEGASSNAWIVTADGVLVTHPADFGILRGVTRTTLFDVTKKEGLTIEERRFTVAEAKAAREAFLTSATTIVTPIVRIDDTPVGDGKPGRVARNLRQRFHTVAEKKPI
jgi:D-alanine transaminase